MGPKTDNSPICNAFTKQAFPTEHNKPAVTAKIQNSLGKLIQSIFNAKGTHNIPKIKYV